MITLFYALILFPLFLLCSWGWGWWLTRGWQFSPAYKFVSALTISIIFWSGSGYALGYAGIRNLSFILAIFGFFFLYKQRITLKNEIADLIDKIFRADKVVVIITVIGLCLQLLGISGSGLPNPNGDRWFQRLQSSDGLLHITFANSIKNQFPPQQPGAYGLAITNYHYWMNLYVGEISRIFFIPVDLLFFQLLPPFLSFLMVMHLLVIVRELKSSKFIDRWVLFFHFFAGNATFVFTYLISHTISFNNPAIDHGMIQFYNPPQAFAKLLFFFGTVLYIRSLKCPRMRWFLGSAVVFASLFGFKIYFGIFAGLLLGCRYMINLRRLKLDKILFYETISLICFLVVALAIFIPPNIAAGGLFWAPLVWPKILLGYENLDWNIWWLRMQVYEAAGNIRGIAFYSGLGIAIFVASIGGTRLLGLLAIINNRENKYFKLWFWLYNGLSILFFFIGMNFLQTSGGANVFNFFIVALIIFGISSAYTLDFIHRHVPRSLSIILTLIVVFFSIPRPLNEVWLLARSFTLHEGSFILENDEHAALLALKKMEGDVYQSHPDDLYDYQETPYRAFYSNKPAFIAGAGILESHNQPIKERRLKVVDMFNSDSAIEFASKGKALNIDYIFLPNQFRDRLKFPWKQALAEGTLIQLYANEGYTIFSYR